MQNPLRSEAEAYRFLLGGIGYFALIVLAKLLIGSTAALVVSVVLSAAVVAWFVRGGRAEPPLPVVTRPSDEGVRRILVVANETVGAAALRECIEARSADVREDVLVIAPALNSRVRHWTSDEDEARSAAQARLDASLAALERAGIRARGEVGPDEPLQAIEDAMRTFGADEMIISTHPHGRSNWLEQHVVEQARERFDVPIRHVVVDVGVGGEREARG